MNLIKQPTLIKNFEIENFRIEGYKKLDLMDFEVYWKWWVSLLQFFYNVKNTNPIYLIFRCYNSQVTIDLYELILFIISYVYKKTCLRYSQLCGHPLTCHLYVLFWSFSSCLLAYSCHSLTKTIFCLVISSVILMNWPFNIVKFRRNCNLTSTLSRETFKGLFLSFDALSFMHIQIHWIHVGLNLIPFSFMIMFSTYLRSSYFNSCQLTLLLNEL